MIFFASLVSDGRVTRREDAFTEAPFQTTVDALPVSLAGRLPIASSCVTKSQARRPIKCNPSSDSVAHDTYAARTPAVGVVSPGCVLPGSRLDSQGDGEPVYVCASLGSDLSKKPVWIVDSSDDDDDVYDLSLLASPSVGCRDEARSSSEVVEGMETERGSPAADDDGIAGFGGDLSRSFYSQAAGSVDDASPPMDVDCLREACVSLLTQRAQPDVSKWQKYQETQESVSVDSSARHYHGRFSSVGEDRPRTPLSTLDQQALSGCAAEKRGELLTVTARGRSARSSFKLPRRLSAGTDSDCMSTPCTITPPRSSADKPTEVSSVDC